MSTKTNLPVITLQLKNHKKYKKNLAKLLNYLDRYKSRSLIVAPEVCLSDYDFEHIDEAVLFGEIALQKLLEKVNKQILVLTLLCKDGADYTNDAVVIHKGKVVHRQSKHKLFLLGDEHKYLNVGSESNIKLFEIDGVKYGLLICFELRFKKLWKRLEGADVIMVPSQWGIARKRHLEVLSGALAIMNQCYVIVSNSSKEDMASSSGIFSPSGGVVMDDMMEAIEGEIDFSLIKKMRRYLVMD